MAANTAPIFGLTPNLGRATIVQGSAQIKSNGTSAGSAGADIMYKVFTSGANGSYLDRVRFQSVATAATTGVATTLRVYISTVSAPGATVGGTDTWILGEVSAPAVPSANSTNATNYYDVVLEMIIPTGFYIHVSQHVAQTANQNWQAIAIGSDY